MNLRSTAHRFAWGLLAFVGCLVCIESYGGLMEWRFRLAAVPVEARVDRASVAPEWTVAFSWNGELHTAHTGRLSGSPLEGDRITILVDPGDPAVVTSPDMTLDDWSDLPGFIAGCVSSVLVAVGILLRVRRPADEPPDRPIPRPRGGRPARPRRNRRRTRRR